MPNSLSLRIVVPDPTEVGSSVQVRPIVDGRDILDEVFSEGPGAQPEELLTPQGPLSADVEPHEARLATAICAESCCGAIYVTVYRDGDQVVWGSWRNPDDASVDLPEFRFDADEYRHQLDQARLNTTWEWPARTVARLLEEKLRDAPELLAHWSCELHAVAAWPWRRDEVVVLLFHPGRPTTYPDRPWQQLQLVFPVLQDDLADQVDRLFAQLTVVDPRPKASVCGGG
ncbi:hypothetical protein AB0877_04665 [Micromonospora sp. NPDC047644]|uniref:hypothetical protein n=1 Tax=Micromonospora sp. NPDC047644 TaxID=3157203 RepID=UPI0034532D5D